MRKCFGMAVLYYNKTKDITFFIVIDIVYCNWYIIKILLVLD